MIFANFVLVDKSRNGLKIYLNKVLTESELVADSYNYDELYELKILALWNSYCTIDRNC